MEVQGTIKTIKKTQSFGTGNFTKRDMILLTAEQYPQPLLIEFIKDKTELLDKVNEGDNVKISINLRGREWVSPDGEVKYFNSITGWRIEAMQENEMPSGPQPVKELNNEVDDLPF